MPITFEDFRRELRAIPDKTCASGYVLAYTLPDVTVAEVERFAGKPDWEVVYENGRTSMRWTADGYTFISGIVRDGVVEAGRLYRGTPSGAYL